MFLRAWVGEACDNNDFSFSICFLLAKETLFLTFSLWCCGNVLFTEGLGDIKSCWVFLPPALYLPIFTHIYLFLPNFSFRRRVHRPTVGPDLCAAKSRGPGSRPAQRSGNIGGSPEKRRGPLEKRRDDGEAPDKRIERRWLPWKRIQEVLENRLKHIGEVLVSWHWRDSWETLKILLTGDEETWDMRWRDVGEMLETYWRDKGERP